MEGHPLLNVLYGFGRSPKFDRWMLDRLDDSGYQRHRKDDGHPKDDTLGSHLEPLGEAIVVRMDRLVFWPLFAQPSEGRPSLDVLYLRDLGFALGTVPRNLSSGSEKVPLSAQ